MTEADLMTGHGDIPLSVQATKAGAVECLTAPVYDQDLLDVIGQAIECDAWTTAAHGSGGVTPSL
jgi:FixJ family two-component response regulator